MATSPILAHNIERFRTARGLSRADAAEKAGVHYASWYRWETGRTAPSVEQLGRVADLLGVDVVDLFTPEAVAS